MSVVVTSLELCGESARELAGKARDLVQALKVHGKLAAAFAAEDAAYLLGQIAYGCNGRDRTAERSCCDMHNVHCEPPSELCCPACTEAAHPQHPRGVACVLDGTA